MPDALRPSEYIHDEFRRKKFEKCTDGEQRAIEILRKLMELEGAVEGDKNKELLRSARAGITGNLEAILSDLQHRSEVRTDEIAPMADMVLRDE
jgi:hypothetical protein